MLKTKPIISDIEKTDGIRMSVMSRHTLNDGITPNLNILPQHYNLWLPSLAPPAKLLGDYYKRGLSWDDFSNRFLDFTHTKNTESTITLIGTSALRINVTLLCIEDNLDRCHRSLLAKRFKELIPNLDMDLK